MSEVEPQCAEPNDVYKYYHRVAECRVHELVRVYRLVAHEFLKLHVVPKMRKVEYKASENDDT